MLFLNLLLTQLVIASEVPNASAIQADEGKLKASIERAVTRNLSHDGWKAVSVDPQKAKILEDNVFILVSLFETQKGYTYKDFDALYDIAFEIQDIKEERLEKIFKSMEYIAAIQEFHKDVGFKDILAWLKWVEFHGSLLEDAEFERNLQFMDALVRALDGTFKLAPGSAATALGECRGFDWQKPYHHTLDETVSPEKVADRIKVILAKYWKGKPVINEIGYHTFANFFVSLRVSDEDFEKLMEKLDTLHRVVPDLFFSYTHPEYRLKTLSDVVKNVSFYWLNDDLGKRLEKLVAVQNAKGTSFNLTQLERILPKDRGRLDWDLFDAASVDEVMAAANTYYVDTNVGYSGGHSPIWYHIIHELKMAQVRKTSNSAN